MHFYRSKIIIAPPLTATSLQRPFFCPGRVHILTLVSIPLQRQWPLKRVPNCQNNSSTTASFFSDWWKSQEWPWNLIPMVRRWLIAAIAFWMSSIYIVYDIYSKCCEPCLSCHINILIENIIQVFCVCYRSNFYSGYFL